LGLIRRADFARAVDIPSWILQLCEFLKEAFNAAFSSAGLEDYLKKFI